MKELRRIGWIAVAFGIFFSRFVIAFLLGPLVAGIAGLANGQNGAWFFLGFAAFSLLARMIHGLANCFANVYALKRLRSLLEKQSAY
ncbi:hypothetical protein [Novipirellula aureliae]|uniref:hypothetical protein n=1 Tax=Novipirellula aureliae TaxID=2527966 RepID=UPI0011B72B55|nr:hypothetical protein [Novipirellula aureliae]